MTSILNEAHAAAQTAWRVAVDNHIRTRTWDPVLVAAVEDAERWVDAVEAAETLPEWFLNAWHDGRSAEMDELADAETDRLPDIPLAWTHLVDWSEVELRLAAGDR